MPFLLLLLHNVGHAVSTQGNMLIDHRDKRGRSILPLFSAHREGGRRTERRDVEGGQNGMTRRTNWQSM